ncbi:DUF4157 domain-containing protein [Archangium gephyra]|uniref:eCIS core domain-containing protein n=1 Tax=Archangium gephyra TaxID=48 RepID=UPI0035D4A7F9
MPSTSRTPAESTGRALPPRLRGALETLSGYDLSDVRVHADSALPAQVGARAFAHGCDIYLERGAEETLAHEAWHVVQQKQGRVLATGLSQFEDERLGVVERNDEEALELEAEWMGRLAQRLVVRGEQLPARRTLRFAAPRQPVVQLHTTVGDKAYPPNEAAAFEDAVSKSLGPAINKIKELSTIIKDLHTEDLRFADWSAVTREVHIRNAGYQAEAAMRQLLTSNRDRYNEAKTEADKKADAAMKQFREEQKKNVLDRRFQFGGDCSDYTLSLKRKAEEGIARWGPASFLTKYMYDCTTRPMFKWFMDRAPEPQVMNCWEAVIFALVKTGLVDKTYIGWCNSKGDRSAFPGMEKMGSFTVLHQQLIKNMDYYWGKAPDAFKNVPNIKNKLKANQDKFRVTQAGPQFFVPKRMKIPRGRVLLFDMGKHVAISTGQLVDLPAKDLTMYRYFQGTRIGHGMIELDSKYPDDQITFREGCIEELAECHMDYLANMVVAPFPICLESGQILLEGEAVEDDLVNHPDVVGAVENYLQAHASEISAEKNAIYKRRDEKLAELTEQLLETDPDPASKPPSEQQQEYTRLEQALVNTQTQAVREINECISEWKRKSKESDEVARAITKARQDIEANGRIVFNYNQNDPYGGAIQF